MRRLLLPIALVGAATARAETDGPRRFVWPLGSAPDAHAHAPLPPTGDALRALGVPSQAMAREVAPLPHAQDAGIAAWIRTREMVSAATGELRTTRYDAVVVRAADGDVARVMDHPEGWRQAVVAWSGPRPTDPAAAWALAAIHLNACVDVRRSGPPYNPRRADRLDAAAPAAAIAVAEDGSATLSYAWWGPAGRPRPVEVRIGQDDCPVR